MKRLALSHCAHIGERHYTYRVSKRPNGQAIWLLKGFKKGRSALGHPRYGRPAKAYETFCKHFVYVTEN